MKTLLTACLVSLAFALISLAQSPAPPQTSQPGAPPVARPGAPAAASPGAPAGASPGAPAAASPGAPAAVNPAAPAQPGQQLVDRQVPQGRSNHVAHFDRIDHRTHCGDGANFLVGWPLVSS